MLARCLHLLCSHSHGPYTPHGQQGGGMKDLALGGWEAVPGASPGLQHRADAVPPKTLIITERKKKKKEPSNLNIFEKKKRNPLWPQNARGHVLSWQPAETSPICTILQRMCRELSSQPRLVCLQDCNKPHSKLSCKISIGFTVQISLSDNGVS